MTETTWLRRFRFGVLGSLGLLTCLVVGVSRAQAETATEQLVVFVQPGVSDVAEAFAHETLPDVEAMADEMGVEVLTIDVTQRGAPEGIRLTPLMVYQNHRGRFPYLGRFTTIDRLRNHIRTARFGGAPEDVRTSMDGVPREAMGRAVVGTPIKVTELTGPGVETNHRAAVQRVGHESIIAALSGESEATGRPMDRLFYVDFYPYLAEDGTLFISTALFSQFHCHEPVFVSESPTSGPADQAARVLTNAVAALAAEVDRQLDNPENGDGFDPIAVDAPTPTWDELGLPLPAEPEGPQVDPADLELVREWTVDQDAVARRPVVQFRFPEPIVGYAGEAQELTGSVTLGEGLTLGDATGEFVVPVRSVTMGEPDLDSYIHSGMLNASENPTSRFAFKSIEVSGEGVQPAFGQVIPGKLIGEFTLKSITIPLTVPVSIEAFAGDDGRPRLAFAGTWTLGPLDDRFGISDAPPGPDEASTRLKFDCYIVLEPSG